MMGEEGVGSPFSPWETNRLFMCLVQRGTYKYVGCQLLLWSGRENYGGSLSHILGTIS